MVKVLAILLPSHTLADQRRFLVTTGASADLEDVNFVENFAVSAIAITTGATLNTLVHRDVTSTLSSEHAHNFMHIIKRRSMQCTPTAHRPVCDCQHTSECDQSELSCWCTDKIVSNLRLLRSFVWCGDTAGFHMPFDSVHERKLIQSVVLGCLGFYWLCHVGSTAISM